MPAKDQKKQNEKRRARIANDPEYKTLVNTRQKAYRNKWTPEQREQRRAYQRAYHADPQNRERMKARSRERYASDPEYRERERARKKSPEYRANYRAYTRQRYYSMAQAEFDAMLEAQGGVCRICGRAERLFVDHCHITGVARGLLCPNCNTGIGMLGDTAEAIANALEYLRDAERRIAGAK